MTEPKTIDEAGLTDIARRATDHTHDARSGCACMDALRLVSEVRRLSQLVGDVYVAIVERDTDRDVSRELLARLKAESDRG
jgi:hypothetical protein